MIRRLTTGIALGAAALLLGGVAFASIPGSNGLIWSCRNTQTGAARLVDAEAGQRCRAGEQAVSWNRQGPRGPAGPRGYPGPKGDKGDPGPAGSLRGYAYVDGTGSYLSARSRGVVGVSPANSPLGPWSEVFCFDLNFTPAVAVATGLITNPPDAEVRAVGPNAGQVLFVAGTSGPITCPAPYTDAAVSMWGANQVPLFEPAGFSVVFN